MDDIGAKQSDVKEFLWKGRTGPFTVLLTPEVFQPTHTSLALADALEINPGETVIDVGCGCGVLSFVSARLGAGRVYGCDISAQAVEVATENARRLGHSDVVEFRAGNMLDPVEGVEADVIIGDIAGIPDEIAKLTGWFPGGPTGAELLIAMLDKVTSCLKRGGRMYLPTGTIQAEEKVLSAARKIFGSGMQLLLQREFPVSAVVARSAPVRDMMSKGIVDLKQRGSRLLWRLAIWRCELPSTG